MVSTVVHMKFATWCNLVDAIYIPSSAVHLISKTVNVYTSSSLHPSKFEPFKKQKQEFQLCTLFYALYNLCVWEKI